jgi:3-deoxy-D-manno-octulosonic-acid transferase
MELVVVGAAQRLARAAYTLALIGLLPVFAGYLIWRGLRQPAYLRYWSERFLGLAAPGFFLAPVGVAFGDQVHRKVLWVHAVSVGETRACAQLIEQWLGLDPSHCVVLTHTTPTGRETGQALLSKWVNPQHGEDARVVQRYLPYDLPWSNACFLGWATPTVGVLMETELWPNLLAQAKARNIPVILANARLSDRSAKRLVAFRALAKPAIASLAVIAAQTQEDANRFRRSASAPGGVVSRAQGRQEAIATGPEVHVIGNMKFDITVPDAQRQLGNQWRTQYGGARVWLAASTRDDEELALLQAWQSAQERAQLGQDVLLIVPRHPQRFDRVARLIEQQGFQVARRSLQWLAGPSQSDPVSSQQHSVLLGDSLGEMFAYLQFSDLVLLGGSIADLGGQNPIEACALGKPVFFGPHMFNFSQIARQLVELGVGSQVSSHANWISQGQALLQDQARRESIQRAALEFCGAHRGATARCLSLVKAILRAEH